MVEEIKAQIALTTKYDGANKLEHPKVVSASELASMELLQMYYARTEKPTKHNRFGRHTVGTLLHLALENIFKHTASVEERIEYTLSNGYLLTAKLDYIDKETDTIIDWKSMSVSRFYREYKKKKESQVVKQLSIQRLLYSRKYMVPYEDIKIYAMNILTDIDPGNEKHPKDGIQEIDVSDVYTEKEIQEFIDKKVEALDELLSQSKPKLQECENLMPRRLNGGGYIMQKCDYYCDFNHICKFNKKRKKFSLGLSWGRA